MKPTPQLSFPLLCGLPPAPPPPPRGPVGTGLGPVPASLPPSPALPEQLSHAAVLAPAAQHWLLSPHRARERAAIIPGLYGFREGVRAA